MKWFAVFLPLMISVAHAQQTMTLNAPTTAATSPTLEPNWEVRIGQTSLNVSDTTYDKTAGSGLTIGGRYDFNPMFAVGGDFTGFRLGLDSYTGYGELYDHRTVSAAVVSAMAEFTPISVTSAVGGVNFNGTILGGGMAGDSRALGDATTLFYGAALGVDYQKQIGVRLETKVSSAFNSMSTLSLIGYY